MKRLRAEAEAKGFVPSAEAELAAAVAKGSGANGGTTTDDVDLYAGGEVTGMED